MVITAYRIHSGFRNVADTISLVRPGEPVLYDELRLTLPSGYDVADTETGPAVFDADGRHCELCYNDLRGTTVLCCSSADIIAIKEAEEESAVNRLREARIAAHLTQKQLADAAGVNIRLVQKIEGGEAKAENITAKNLLALADALGVDPRALI